MKKLLSLSAILAILAMPAFAADKPVVKIGVTIPLTGDLGFMGDGVKNAMMMAKEDMPKDTRFDYELVFEDDMLAPARAASTSNKMISVDKADALVSITSGIGGVVSPIAEQNKVIHFGMASAANVADGDYNFNHWTSPEEEGRLMAAELQKRGYKNIAGLFLNQQGVLAIRDSFLKNLEGTGIKMVTDEIINPGEKDFRTAISKAKASNPDIYMVIFFSPELEIAVKQIKEAGITTPITNIEAFSISDQQSLYEGNWYVDAAESSAAFNEKYAQKFGKNPVFGSGNSYDIFNMIVKAYEGTGAGETKPEHSDVVKTLYTFKDYDGVMGKLSIDDKGVVYSPASVKIIKDGKPVLFDSVAQAPADAAPAATEPAAQ